MSVGAGARPGEDNDAGDPSATPATCRPPRRLQIVGYACGHSWPNLRQTVFDTLTIRTISAASHTDTDRHRLWNLRGNRCKHRLQLGIGDQPKVRRTRRNSGQTFTFQSGGDRRGMSSTTLDPQPGRFFAHRA